VEDGLFVVCFGLRKIRHFLKINIFCFPEMGMVENLDLFSGSTEDAVFSSQRHAEIAHSPPRSS